MSNRVTFDVIANSRATGFAETDARILRQARLAEKASKDSTKQISALTTAIAAVAPAAVPIAAVAGAAFVGLSASAGVALLAVKGIQAEMKAGTPLGKQYKAAFAPVIDEYKQLQRIAAAGVFTGLNRGIQETRSLFPAINRDTAVLSSQLGTIAGNVGSGLVSMFHQFEPILVTVGNELVRGSAAFAKWAQSSGGVSKFVAYAQTQLPAVEHLLGQAALAASHLASAFVPLGGGTLSTLTTLLRLLNAIPIGVLQAAAPAVTGVVLAMKALTAINASRLPITLSLGTMGPLALAAGAGLAILTSQLAANQQAQIRAKQAANDYAQALDASNGAINTNIRQMTAKNLQDAGALDAARKLGLSLSTVTSAALGNADALQQVTETGQRLGLNVTDNGQLLIQAGNQGKNLAQVNQGLAKAYGTVVSAVGAQTTALNSGIQAHQNTTAAVNATNAAMSQMSAAQAAAATKLAITTGAARTQKAELDALNAAMQRLTDGSLGVAQADTAFHAALLQVTESAKQNGRSVADNTAKGIANRQAIESAAQALVAKYNADVKAGRSAVAAAADFERGKAALLHQVGAAYGAKSAADAYARSITNIPGVKSTQLLLNSAAAKAQLDAYKSALASLQNRSITITQYVQQAIIPYARSTYSQHAAGGMLTEGWNSVGERGWEWLYKQGNQVRVYPHGQSGPTGGGGGGTYITINAAGFLDGAQAGRAIAAALERYAGSGGRINISRGVT